MDNYNKIVIGKPYIEKEIEGKVKLKVDIRIGKKRPYVLWYEVDEEYSDYLCKERSDAFVITLLLYAMKNKMDIYCEEVMTERLYYQITEYLIPSISNEIDEYDNITIHTKLTDELLSTNNSVGVALSGGVDSFYTLLRHINRNEKSYEVTHFTFFNVGASGDFGGDKSRKIFNDRINWIKGIAIELNKKFVSVDSNVSELLHQRFEETSSFRNLAVPFILQKMFSVYYLASSFTFSGFKFTYKNPAYYDLLNIYCFSTDNIVFYSSGGETTRLGKIKFISGYPITYDKLNVCVREVTNCSRCEKCWRTMFELYSTGNLELYKNVFDLSYFYSKKYLYVFKAMRYVLKRDYDWIEILKDLANNNQISRFQRMLFYIINKIVNK